MGAVTWIPSTSLLLSYSDTTSTLSCTCPPAITSVGGYIDSITLGDSVTLEAIGEFEWYATSIVGSGWGAH